MLKILVVVAFLFCSRHALADCGEERADVKLGLDAEARRVDLTPTDTSVADLVALKAPHDVRRRSPAEFRVWRVTGTVTAFKLETDGDYHVVISDGHGHTMIVEIPSPECARRSVWADRVKVAREFFADRRPGKHLQHASISVTVEGVGFFDKVHGQAGVAPNGIELHPVLSIVESR